MGPNFWNPYYANRPPFDVGRPNFARWPIKETSENFQVVDCHAYLLPRDGGSPCWDCSDVGEDVRSLECLSSCACSLSYAFCRCTTSNDSGIFSCWCMTIIHNAILLVSCMCTGMSDEILSVIFKCEYTPPSNYRTVIGNHTQSIEWYHFQSVA